MSTAHACQCCTQINPAEASFCLACGAALSTLAYEATEPAALGIDLTRFEKEEDTVPAVHLDAPELQRWVDSGPDELDSTTTPIALNLRSLDEFPVLVDVAQDAETMPPGVVLRSDGEPARPAPARPSVAKAARRAAVRRSRLTGEHPAPAGKSAPRTDVLVLESDPQTREQLCSVLEAFGFRAHPAETAAQAMCLLDARHFAATFLDVGFDGPEQRSSVDLCQRIKTNVPAATGRAAALIIVSGSSRPVERVRATLAGSDVFLLRPITRGSIAQALEACQVPLPADSRRA